MIERELPLLELTVLWAGRRVARVLVQPGRFRVGHGLSNDVSLADPSVSGRHAEVTVGEEGRIYVRDLGSSNGTFVDGELCASPLRIGAGSRVTLGESEISVQPMAAPGAQAWMR